MARNSGRYGKPLSCGKCNATLMMYEAVAYHVRYGILCESCSTPHHVADGDVFVEPEVVSVTADSEDDLLQCSRCRERTVELWEDPYFPDGAATCYDCCYEYGTAIDQLTLAESLVRDRTYDSNQATGFLSG
jgi:hypothetical protein